MNKEFDLTVLVTCKESLAKKRFKKKGFTESDFDRRMERHFSEETKLKRADFIIANDATLNELEEKAKKRKAGDSVYSSADPVALMVFLQNPLSWLIIIGGGFLLAYVVKVNSQNKTNTRKNTKNYLSEFLLMNKKPVPDGAKIHLWRLAEYASHPKSLISMGN